MDDQRRASGRDRSGLSPTKMREAESNLGSYWEKFTRAGEQSDDVTISSAGKHACGAKATLRDKTVIIGKFKDDDYHAEMHCIEQAIQSGRLGEIESIEIEKEPCPRCAVVLNLLQDALGFRWKITFKSHGQKDYPTWKFPRADGVDWADVMDVDVHAAKKNDQKSLLSYFCYFKWWQ